MRQRFAPFLVLIEARYAPLLFAVAPQSYAVFLWLWRGSDLTDASFWFAVMGALGYELVYVGAIAWAEEGRSSFWTWATAGVALVFSIVVAFYVYRAQGAWAWLHAGFPLVAFTYTLNMHSKRPASAIPSTAQAPLQTLPERLGMKEGAGPLSLPVEMAPSALVAPPLGNGKHPTDGQATWLDELLTGQALASAPLETIVVEEAHRYHCPHCSERLASKQALGAAHKNGYCLNCKGRSA
jgi:hypothetical protein